MSAWIPEKNNIPARLQLIKMPSRQELAAKNLFSVRDATINWHPEGRSSEKGALRKRFVKIEKLLKYRGCRRCTSAQKCCLGISQPLDYTFVLQKSSSWNMPLHVL